MKLNCAKPSEKTRGVRLRRGYRIAMLEQWHPYFAWRPVHCDDGSCRWLEWVARKCNIGDSVGRRLFLKGKPEYADHRPVYTPLETLNTDWLKYGEDRE